MRRSILVLLLGSAASLLAACVSSDHAGHGGWTWEGGQTGSLMPACGLTPATELRGVPAAAPGFVLVPSACGDPRALDELAVLDASGRPVAFDRALLPGGELLLRFPGGIAPGVYTVGATPAAEPDEDGGLEDGGLEAALDAGAVADPGAREVVVSDAPRPPRFGEVSRSRGACSAVLELTPDASALPFLAVLSIDVQVEDEPSTVLVRTGTLKLVGGVARVMLPTAALDARADGEHTLRVVARIAGDPVPLETFMVTVRVPCDAAHYGESDELAGPCSARALGRAAPVQRSSALAGGAVLAWLALRARRRRRPPA